MRAPLRPTEVLPAQAGFFALRSLTEPTRDVYMTAKNDIKVTTRMTLDGDYRWKLVQRCSLLRRKTLAAAQPQFLTRQGAYAEGLKELRRLTSTIGSDANPKNPRTEPHLHVV
jgi:hypothetical protein